MKRFRPWLVVALVFLAGAVFGVVATRIVVRHIVRTAILQPERMRERIERDLTRKLKLTEEQRPNVHATLIQAHERLQALRQEFQPRFVLIITQAQQEVSAVLAPEQRERFEKFKRETRPFWRPAE